MGDVLLIDDDDATLDLLGLFLEAEGWSVVKAHNGLEGTEKMPGSNFGLIIADLMMPVMDGVRFLEWLHRNVEARPPVIVLSSAGRGELEREARQAGAALVVQKPVLPEDFIENIKTVMQG